MLRTHEEIAERCRQPLSIYGHDIDILLNYIPYVYAKEFLIDTDDFYKWDLTVREPTKENVLMDMEKAMFIIWAKILFHTHLSGVRNIERMCSWLWLLDDKKLLKFAIEGNNYPMYGAPIFAKICEKYNFKMPTSKKIQNMVNGEPCSPNCKEGCVE